MTPEMMESLELLQMPLLELRKKVAQAVLDNPVLEYDEESQIVDNEFSDCSLGVDSETYYDEKAVLEFAKRLSSDTFFPDSCKAHGSDEEDFSQFATLTAKVTFTDYLLEQLGELKIDAVTEQICRYIIEDLDERGYLVDSAEELSHELNIPYKIINNALKIVQQMQPAGVGSANLQECLTFQLLQNPECNDNLIKIIEEHMKLLAENKIREIAKKLALPIETVQEYCNIIHRLNPIPSSGFNTQTDGGFIIPEATISKVGDDFIIQCNDYVVPHLCISTYYQQMVNNLNDKETVEYLKDKIRRASSMIKELLNRGNTIPRILKKIVELQKPYFENGSKYLKPMTISDIAMALNLHKSTVSRAIHGKYITCQFGTISLKSLFTSKICTQHGDNCFSSSQIKEMIRTLINHEDKSVPISDQGITKILQEYGIDISRRTVAKYRDVMRLPAAKNRRIYILK